MKKLAAKARRLLAERILEIGHLPYRDTPIRGGPTRAQWALLRYLSRANQFSRTVSAFRAYYGVTTGTASETARRLVERGLLERRRSAADARSVRLDLTPKAWAVMKADPARMLKDLFGGLPASQAIALAAALEEVAVGFAQRQGRRAFGSCGGCRHFQRESRPQGRDRPGCTLMAVRLARAELHALCARFEAP